MKCPDDTSTQQSLDTRNDTVLWFEASDYKELYKRTESSW